MRVFFRHCQQGPRAAGRRETAMALVVTLALLLLVTVLVFAFFTVMTRHRSLQASRASQIEADLLAQSAADYVTDRFLRELASQSTNVAVPGGVTNLFLPLTRSGMVPQRMVASAATGPDFPTLIRQSIVGVDSNSSDHFTSQPAKNSRVISPQRWNAPRLTVGSGFTSNAVPAWIYVSAGAGPGSAPGAGSIGRFAYNVYDISGLLDINAAGHPETLFAGQSRPKDTLAGAALRALHPNLSLGAISNLMKFRSPADLATKDGFSRNAGAFAGIGYRDVTATVTEGGTNRTYTNNFFCDRQDLLRFARMAASDNSLLDVLPYLSTFSRSTAGPVWEPARNSSDSPGYFAAAQSAAVYPYHDDATKTNSINPRLLTFAFGTPAEIRHYRDDGTVEKTDPSLSFSYRAEAGTPVVHRRFSLAKLAWLGSDGPNPQAFHASVSAAERTAAIRECFGLTWNTAGPFPRWIYDHGDPARILTLDEVRQAGRPPDFFELLKSVILAGSLGKHPGAGSGTDHGSTASPVAGLRFDEIFRHADGQILQIGANIIDQADTDSFPTAIASDIPLQSFSSPEVFSEASRELFKSTMGVENIPYLLRVWNPVLTSEGTKVRGWWWPEMWSPHRRPASTGGLRPTVFRVRALGFSQTSVVFNPAENLYTGAAYNQSPETDHENDPRGFVEFQDGDFYDRPRRLQTDLDDFPGSSTDAMNKWNAADYPEKNLKFLGIFTGEANRPEPVKTTLVRRSSGGSAWFDPRSTFPPGQPPVTLVTEYRDQNGAWRPASLLARFNKIRRNSTQAVSSGTVSATFFDSVVRGCVGKLDPRTDRFASSGAENDSWNYGGQMWRAASPTVNSRRPFYCPDPVTGIYRNGTEANRGRFGDYARNQIALTNFYSDPDGVVRPGDGFRTDLTNDDGNPLLLGTSTGSQSRRPVILDRPFQSVGELGGVFRDSPMRNLDFWTRDSADAGLLDVFSVRDEPLVGGGKINPNAAPAPVLKALLMGGAKHATDSSVPAMTSTEADAISGALAAALRQAPLMNSAEYVTELADVISGSQSATFRVNKSLAEAPLRALAEVTNVRTWTLLVDIVGQSGKFAGPGTAAGNFVVEGEKRIWVHLAIDRFTGAITGLQMEAVYE